MYQEIVARRNVGHTCISIAVDLTAYRYKIYRYIHTNVGESYVQQFEA